MKKTHKLTPMKKAIILAAIPMLALFANPACAQHRYADLRVKIIDPPPYSIFYSPTVLHYAFEVVNQGPDSLWPMDSMRYEMVHTGGGSRPRQESRLGKYVVREIRLLYTILLVLTIGGTRMTLKFDLLYVLQCLVMIMGVAIYGQNFGKIPKITHAQIIH